MCPSGRLSRVLQNFPTASLSKAASAISSMPNSRHRTALILSPNKTLASLPTGSPMSLFASRIVHREGAFSPTWRKSLRLIPSMCSLAPLTGSGSATSIPLRYRSSLPGSQTRTRPSSAIERRFEYKRSGTSSLPVSVSLFNRYEMKTPRSNKSSQRIPTALRSGP